jgi:hypothetical protein
MIKLVAAYKYDLRNLVFRQRFREILFLSMILSIFCAAGQVIAQQYGRPTNPNQNKVFEPDIWKEHDVFLPSAPSREGFRRVEITGMGDSMFLVDASSVTVSDDGVVRLALAIISERGHGNFFYEGYRCETSEYKSYAFSSGYDQEWTALRSAMWRPVVPRKHYNYRSDLLRHYICSSNFNLSSEEQIKDALIHGKFKEFDLTGERRAR